MKQKDIERQFLNDLWEDMTGLQFPKPEVPDPEPEERKPTLPEQMITEWDDEFEMLMRNRLIVGSMRYGPMAEQDYAKYDLPKDAQNRIDKYKKTRNLEHLVDAANTIMLAYIHGRRNGEELKPIDDGEHTPIVNNVVFKVKGKEIAELVPAQYDSERVG